MSSSLRHPSLLPRLAFPLLFVGLATCASAQLKAKLEQVIEAPRLPTPAPTAAALIACSQCDTIYAGDCGLGLWAIDTTTAVSTFIGNMPTNMFDIGMTPDGQLYGVSGSGTAYAISTCDASATALSSSPGGNGLAGSTSSNILYGQGWPLTTWDPVTGTVTSAGGPWCGSSSGDLAMDPASGVLFSSLAGCGCSGDALVTIDPATGAQIAQIGCLRDTTGNPFFAVFGLAFDSSGNLWGALGTGQPELLHIDPTTAIATVVPITGGFNCAYGLASSPCPRIVNTGCAPLTQGFWKRVCEAPHPSGEHEKLPTYVGCVSAVRTFSSVRNVADVCDRLHPNPTNDKCEQAEAQFMALMLNVCSGRLGRSCCISIPGEDVSTVADAIALIDSLLSQGARTFQDCVRAQAIADAINTGAALCGHTIAPPPAPAPIRPLPQALPHPRVQSFSRR